MVYNRFARDKGIIGDMKNSNCLRASIAIMALTGIWVPKRFSEYPKLYLYMTFTVFSQGIIFISIVLAEIAYFVKVLGDIEKTVDAAVLLLSHLVQGVKVSTIWFRQDRIKNVIKMIDGPNFRRSDPTKKAIIDKTVKLAILVGQLMMSSAAVTGLFWSLVPLLNTEVSLPLKTAYPFDISSFPVFLVMYIYSTISVCLVGVGDAAENYLVSGLLTLAGAQLEVLCHELADIQTGVRRKENDGKKKIRKKATSPSTTGYEEAVACVKYHQNIIEYVEELASIFGLPIFCQFATSSVVLCMAVFKITISTQPIEVITMVFYLICVFMELLMYCYPGDLLINKSILVSEAAYSGNWVDCDVRTRRVLMLTALRAQGALAVCAGGVFRVSLPTAAAVVQTSYSYYAMLKQTNTIS